MKLAVYGWAVCDASNSKTSIFSAIHLGHPARDTNIRLYAHKKHRSYSRRSTERYCDGRKVFEARCIKFMLTGGKQSEKMTGNRRELFGAKIIQVHSGTSRERPKSAPYLRLKKTRKPLFLQLQTTKALKKLKIEKKNSEFFLIFFSKFPVGRIVPKNVKGGRFLSHVRRFGCVENEVLSTYGKNW